MTHDEWLENEPSYAEQDLGDDSKYDAWKDEQAELRSKNNPMPIEPDDFTQHNMDYGIFPDSVIENSITSNWHDAVPQLVFRLRNYQLRDKAFETEIQRLQQRQAMNQKGIEATKILLNTWIPQGEKYSDPILGVSIFRKQSDSVVIDCEVSELRPDHQRIIPQRIEPDKIAIKKWIKHKQSLGVTIGNTYVHLEAIESLVVRFTEKRKPS